ncbi:MAG: NifU family protein [Coriobacteriia bacterium]|nr:NifU family protein [Coriobacteriia bacterium]
MALDKAKVKEVLETIRPRLQADGGDIEFIDVNDKDEVIVALQGACRGCPMSQFTLATQVECILKEAIPEVTGVIPQ